MELFITIITLLSLIVWGIISYNKLVRDRNRVASGWSDIDVQLTRRHELIPNLVNTTKGYADYEQAVLMAVTELRSESEKINPESPDAIGMKGRVEDKLSEGLVKLMALVENYPDLKADGQFLELQEQLVEVEEQLQYARRYYNGAVRNLNTRIEAFPDLIVARLFQFQPAVFFQLESDAAAKAPQVNL